MLAAELDSSKCQTVATQTDLIMNFGSSSRSNSAFSCGSETEEDIDLCDIKPKVTDFFVKIETGINESLIKKEIPEFPLDSNFLRRVSSVGLERLEVPLRIPKIEPIDAELTTVDNSLSQSEIDLTEDEISTEENINISDRQNKNISSVSNAEPLEKCLINKRKKVKKKHLTISQMYEIIQSDNGFFSNKKQWMTKKVLRQLPDKDKIFLSNILKKFKKKKSKTKIKNKVRN